MRTGRVLTLAGLALALVVTGCSEPDVGAGPTPLATPTAGSTSTSPSASPTSPPSSTTTPPTASSSIPAAARAHTNAGAEAFVRYYLSQVNLAWTGPDPSKLEGLASPSCKSCANFAMTARSLQNDGLRYDGAPLRMGLSIILPESTTDIVQLQIINIQEARSIIRANGDVVEVLKRDSSLSQFKLSWMTAAWRVSEVKNVTSQ